MYLEVERGEIRCGEQGWNEIFHQTESSILWANGCLNANLSPEERSKAISALSEKLSFKQADSLFVGGYFVVLADKQRQEIHILRDAMGQKSGYYHYDSKTEILVIGTNMHDIARNITTDLSKFHTDFLLYQQYVVDGSTIYENINEVPAGSLLYWTIGREVKCEEKMSLPIEYVENHLSEEENIRLLREHILHVHSNYAGADNVVYLSGGIDSCVMLASLHNICPDRVRAVSYRVAHTQSDETVYAKEVAHHLGYEPEIVTVDPMDKCIVSDYEADLMKANNPYEGNWIFRPRPTTIGDVRYFAGQDTRLHTPSVNKVDMDVLARISRLGMESSWLERGIVNLYEQISVALGLYNSADRRIKYSHFLLNAMVPEWFLLKRKFMADPVKYKTWGYDETNFRAICDWYALDLKKGMSPREIFNRIVERKWHEQYENDMRYMVDMGIREQVHVLLPFYDCELNRFASTIPWDLANKTMSGLSGFGNKKIQVNKYVLRKAFEKELPWSVMVRAKAVSLSQHLMMNGVFGKKVIQVLQDDLASKESFCRRFGHTDKAQEIIAREGKWVEKDAYLSKFANYLSALCVYYRKNVLGE